MNLRRFSKLTSIVGLALVYFVSAKLSLQLATLNASASPVWPAAGVGLAGLLILGYRAWPGIFLGALAANSTTAGTLLTSLCIGTGNTLEAFCGAWLVNRFAGGRFVFDRSPNVFKFSLAVLASTLVSPFLGVTSLGMAGFADWNNFGAIWLTWWLGDVTGELIIAPLIMLWCERPRWHFNLPRDIEIASLFLLLFLLTEFVFGGWLPISTKNYPVPFICAPLLTWAAFRFSQRETASATLMLTSLATWGTLRGFGPFVKTDSNTSLIIVQSFNAVFAVTALGISAGMAERRRAEAALERQRSEVEAANKTKDNFLAMLSHELRTPLTPVLAALDALEAVPSQTADTRNSLAMIRRNVEVESQLIDDLLDLTRIAKDKLQLNFEKIDAHQAIHDVSDICKMEADARGIRVHLNLRAGAHHVRADTAKFQQIIWNLLKNAIKFTSENGEISITTSNPSPQSLTITVKDSGIGIEPEIIGRIFDPFEQGDQSLQRRFGGLGLGLAISRSLVLAHDGTLVAESEGRGYGSTFTFSLRTVSPPQDIIPEPPTRPASVRGLRILLVDDHQDTCLALERLLVRRGHLVAATHNMRSAMEAAARNQFDLLVSDIALPDGTGMELMACLHAISGLRGIAISGFGMNGDVEKSLQAGFSEHLVKPVKLEKLEAAIERVMAEAPVAR